MSLLYLEYVVIKFIESDFLFHCFWVQPEKRDFTVLLTKFAFIVTFEEFLVLYNEQFFYNCLIKGGGLSLFWELRLY